MQRPNEARLLNRHLDKDARNGLDLKPFCRLLIFFCFVFFSSSHPSGDWSLSEILRCLLAARNYVPYNMM